MAKTRRVGRPRRKTTAAGTLLALLVIVLDPTIEVRLIVWAAITGIVVREVWAFERQWFRAPAMVAVSVAVVVGVAALASFTWPKIYVYEKFPGQWQGYRNTDTVLLDDSARFTMRVGQRQSVFPEIDGSKNLSNVFLSFCVPSTFRMIEGGEDRRYATFARDDADRNRPDWTDCQRYSVAMGRINAGTPMNPNPLLLEAMAAGTHIFRYDVSAAEARLRDGRFAVTVTP